MTNLFYALIVLISGSFSSETPSSYSNGNQPQFEQTQNTNTSSTTDNNDDDDDDDANEDENPYED